MRTAAGGEMMSNFVKQYECEGVSAQPWVQGQAPIERDGRLIFKLDGLGIDDGEIELQLECQVGERLPEIVKDDFQNALAIGSLRLTHFLF